MNRENDELLDQLEEILEKNKDAEKGYRKAGENAESQHLKTFFNQKENERRKFNAELKRELIHNYDEIDDDSSFSGAIHRTWMDVKAFFSGDNDESMLEEAIKGDKASIDEYDEVLDHTALPSSIAILLRNQRNKIIEDLSRIKTMEDFK